MQRRRRANPMKRRRRAKPTNTSWILTWLMWAYLIGTTARRATPSVASPTWLMPCFRARSRVLVRSTRPASRKVASERASH